MTFQQLVTPDPDITCWPGMCLQYVRQAFGAPLVEPTATDGWNKAKYKHTDRNFPDGVWVPLWFAIPGIPAGHVALRAPDGSVYSTSDNSNTPHHHPSLDELIWYYGPRVQPQYQLELQYLGWSEDISTVRVVQELTINTESTTIQEDDLTPEQAAQLAYISSPQFKADIFQGAAPVEVDARRNFIQEIFNADLPWFGFDGRIPEGGRTTTNLKTDLGWADTRIVGLASALAGLTELVKQLSVAQGVTIDYKAIAKAVNDDAAKRLQS